MRTADVPAGTVLGTPVVSEQGMVIIQAGTTLNEQLIERLQQRGVPYVLVEWPGFEGLGDFEPLSEHTFAGIRGFLRTLIQATRDAASSRSVRLPLRDLGQWVETIVEELED